MKKKILKLRRKILKCLTIILSDSYKSHDLLQKKETIVWLVSGFFYAIILKMWFHKIYNNKT